MTLHVVFLFVVFVSGLVEDNLSGRWFSSTAGIWRGFVPHTCCGGRDAANEFSRILQCSKKMKNGCPSTPNQQTRGPASELIRPAALTLPGTVKAGAAQRVIDERRGNFLFRCRRRQDGWLRMSFSVVCPATAVSILDVWHTNQGKHEYFRTAMLVSWVEGCREAGGGRACR